MGKPGLAVRWCILVTLLYGTTMLGSDALPVRQVTAGCRDHCLAYTEDGGDYSACVDQCPAEADCVKAMSSSDPEEYIDEIPGLPQRPRPCANHCWRDTVYAMHPCMRDCPDTWCRLYGGVTLPTTTTPTTTTTTTPPTTTEKTTAAEVSKTTEGPKVQQIVDGGVEEGPVSNNHGSNAAIGLAVLALCTVIGGAIVGTILCKRRQHRQCVQQAESRQNIPVPRGRTIEPTSPQGDVGGFPATSSVISDAHATSIVTSVSERLPQI